MIARNFIRFPAALLAQLELPLVIAAAERMTKEASQRIARSARATVAWACQFASAPEPKEAAPAWFTAMQRRSKTLALSVQAACRDLI
ncbi:MAG: hypothetical protein U1E04_02790 [Hylemonella sp.]|nr:hypothetical protein [Hylemonella sp.]